MVESEIGIFDRPTCLCPVRLVPRGIRFADMKFVLFTFNCTIYNENRPDLSRVISRPR